MVPAVDITPPSTEAPYGHSMLPAHGPKFAFFEC